MLAHLILIFSDRSLVELGLDLADEGRTHALLVLVRRRVQVEDLRDLRNFQLVAHAANLLHVFVRFASLKKGNKLKILLDISFM